MRTITFWGLSATAWTGIYTLLTAGLVAIAVVAALYAKRQWESARGQVEEMRKAELEGRRPYVIVTVEPSEVSRHLFDLVIRNIGQRPAEVVSISLDPPPIRARETDGYELANAKMLKEPVEMIAPGQEMRAYYDSHIERNGRDDLPTTHRVQLSYKDSSGNEYKGTSIVDINAMRGTIFTTVMTVHDIAKSLAEIQKSLANASVLGRQGTLEAEVSVESRVEQQERLAREQAEAVRRRDRLARRLPPNGTGTDASSDPA
jgi:hypothetical protein